MDSTYLLYEDYLVSVRELFLKGPLNLDFNPITNKLN